MCSCFGLESLLSIIHKQLHVAQIICASLFHTQQTKKGLVKNESSASTRNRGRTGTGITAHRILSPACLPIPPSEQPGLRKRRRKCTTFNLKFQNFLRYTTNHCHIRECYWCCCRTPQWLGESRYAVLGVLHSSSLQVYMSCISAQI